MKKTAKRIAATLLAGTMMLSMGMTAMAADTGFQAGTDSVIEVPFAKEVLTDGKTYAPNTQFEFEVLESGTAGVLLVGWGNETVYPGNQAHDGLTVTNPDAFSANDGISNLKKNGKLSINLDKFTKPGIYHYVLKEKDTTYEGITKDPSVYDVYVTVVVVDGVKKAGIRFVERNADGTAGTTKDSNVTFQNKYNSESGVKTLKVEKQITGNQSVASHEFSFSIKVESTADSNRKYHVVKYNGADDEVGTVVDEITSGVATTSYKLYDDQYLVVYGLSSNDTYTVEETDANTDGYTTKYYYDNMESTEITLNKDNAVVGKSNSNGVHIIVNNDKNSSAPTGIVMTFAPYILMIGAACVLMVVFLRKKREEEDI